GDNQPAVNAQLYNPYGTVKDSAGNLYIADTYNHAIRKVDTAGKITTFAGSPQHCGYTGDGGPATTAWMCYPAGLAIDSSNASSVADSGTHVVRKIASGTINTVAGINRAGYSGDGGPATSAQLYNPYGVAVDGTGNVYIADTNNCRIRMVNAFTQIITT